MVDIPLLIGSHKNRHYDQYLMRLQGRRSISLAMIQQIYLLDILVDKARLEQLSFTTIDWSPTGNQTVALRTVLDCILLTWHT
jgi:hypothetical protein